MLEVLSPAGSYDAAIAAVRSGADAIYLGLGDFNARRNAQNFSTQTLEETIKYCHTRGVKVYLTLNTLVKGGEFSSALAAAEIAERSGIDAFILQDLGLTSEIRRRFQNVPLHASTQLSVHSYKAVSVLYKMGFSRVVPSREMDMENLKKLCEEAVKYGLEVEVFVHGALCMSLSGQCYLSGLLGGRSGNRGLCAGPCRLPFSVERGTGHDLSLRDLNMLEHIKELEKMGVTSLKIEGRMKRPEYVAAATNAYRLAADGETVPPEHLKLLGEIFSRNGFTNGYFTGNPCKEMFGMRSEEEERISAAAQNSIHNIYRAERAAVPVFAEFSADENGSKLILSDGENEVTIKSEAAEEAKTKALTHDDAFKQFSRLGGSPYYLKSLKTSVKGGLFVPPGRLNAMRREAVEKLSAVRENKNFRANVLPAPNSDETATPAPCKELMCGEKPRLIAAFRNESQIPKDTSLLDGIILPVEADFENVKKDVPLFADLPRGMLGTEAKVAEQLKKAKDAGVRAAFCGNLASLALCREVGMFPIADFGINIMNAECLKAAGNLGFSGALLSFENTAADIKNITENGILKGNNANDNTMPKGFIIYGALPLMLCRNCPNKNGNGCEKCSGVSNITDRMGVNFPLACRNGFTELYNSRPVYVADRIVEFGSPDFAVARFTFETREECEKIIKNIAKKAAPQGEYTRGFYYRAVK